MNDEKMTATERLRQLLDKRGVEWEDADPYQDATAWVGSNNIEYVAHEGISFDGPTGRLILFCLTPEQAVEATLGRGTCKNVYEKGHFKCSECNHYTQTRMVYRDGKPADPRYCPNCGRKVVE